MSETTLDKLRDLKFRFAADNPEAVAEVERRLAKAAAGDTGTVNYERLLAGLKIQTRSGVRVNTGQGVNPFWRQVAAHLLGYVSRKTYIEGGFLAGALVGGKSTGRPSQPFFDFAESIGLLTDRSPEGEEAFWTEQVRRAREYYTRRPVGRARITDLPDFLTQGADGWLHLTGRRVGLQNIVAKYNEGYSVEMLGAHFPTLPLALLHKVIAFYLEHRDELDAYLAQEANEIEHLRQRATGPTLRDLRERLRKAKAG